MANPSVYDKKLVRDAVSSDDSDFPDVGDQEQVVNIDVAQAREALVYVILGSGTTSCDVTPGVLNPTEDGFIAGESQNGITESKPFSLDVAGLKKLTFKITNTAGSPVSVSIYVSLVC